MRKTLGGGKRFAFAAGGPMRTAVLRGRRSYADGGPTRTAVLRGRRSYADGGPARTAVLRGQRQRDLSLWTPIHRLRAGRGSYEGILQNMSNDMF